MTPTRGRSARASRTGSRPRTRTVPWSGRRYPSQISMVVVLPAPFGPKMPVTAPRAALSVSPSTAVVWPYRLTSLPISTAGTCGTVLTDASLRRQQPAQRGGVDDLRPPREDPAQQDVADLLVGIFPVRWTASLCCMLPHVTTEEGRPDGPGPRAQPAHRRARRGAGPAEGRRDRGPGGPPVRGGQRGRRHRRRGAAAGGRGAG